MIPATPFDVTNLVVVPGVLDRELVTDLLEHADRVTWFRSPMLRPGRGDEVTLVADRTVKARHDHPLRERTLVQALGRSMLDRLLPEVGRRFGFVPTAHEACKIVRYDAGDGWFAPHRDNVSPDAAHRRLAVTINLDSEYTGGDLRFPELGVDVHRPAPGDAFVFPCGLLHEVTPVTTGSRHAVITFLW